MRFTHEVPEVALMLGVSWFVCPVLHWTPRRASGLCPPHTASSGDSPASRSPSVPSVDIGSCSCSVRVTQGQCQGLWAGPRLEGGRSLALCLPSKESDSLTRCRSGQDETLFYL